MCELILTPYQLTFYVNQRTKDFIRHIYDRSDTDIDGEAWLEDAIRIDLTLFSEGGVFTEEG